MNGLASLSTEEGEQDIRQKQETRIKVYFLGGVRILYGKRVMSGFATQKVLGLFCYLLDHHKQPLGRDKLMTLFWGESPESQARYNLRYALWNIRKLFKKSVGDPDPILSTRTTCQIHPDFKLDSDTEIFSNALKTPSGPSRLASLQKAVDLYKGPFLEGFTIKNLPEWEEWLYHRREGLHEEYLRAIVELGNIYLEQQQANKAVTTFLNALTAAGYLEPAHQGLIQAYAQQGRFSAAMRQYAIYTEAMKREFNAPPSSQITELVETMKAGKYDSGIVPAETAEKEVIVDQDSPGKPTEAEPRQTGASAAQEDKQTASIQVNTVVSPSPILSQLGEESVLIGRKDELDGLVSSMEEVRSGNGQAVIISGEMGIGKTRLFHELLRKVPPDFFVATGEAQEINSAQPLEDLLQILQSFEMDDRISAERRNELQELIQRFPRIDSTEDEISEMQLIESIRRWIIALAKKHPVMIAIDDLHWASRALLNLFEELSTDTKRMPLFIVGIFRTFEVQSEDTIAATLISIARTGKLKRIELMQLSDEETLELITQRAMGVVEKLMDDDREKLTRFSCGIPLFAIELSNFLREENLDILRSSVLADQPEFSSKREQQLVPSLMLKIAHLRLGYLNEKERNLIKNASLLLNEFSIPLLRQLLSFSTDTLEDILVELEHYNLIHHIEKGNDLLFSFNHLLIKLAIVETIPVLERRRMYKKIAEAYVQANVSVSTDAMAYYLYHAGKRVEAIPYLLASSHQWFNYGEKDIGLKYSKTAYPIALEELENEPEKMIEVILRHGENLIRHGMVKAAMDVFNEAIGRLEAIGSQARQQKLLSKREELKTLLKTEPDHPKTTELAPMAMVSAKRALAKVKLITGDLVDAQRLITETEKLLDSLPDTNTTIHETGMLFQVKARLAIRNANLDQAESILYNSLELLRHFGEPEEIAESYRLLAHLYRINLKFERAEVALQKCREYCNKGGDSSTIVQCHHERGMLFYARDMLEEAANEMREALEISQSSTTLISLMPTIIPDFAAILFAMGRNNIAEELLKNVEKSEESVHKSLDSILARLRSD